MTNFDDRTDDALGLEIVAPLRQMRPHLDELHRARLYAALEDHLYTSAFGRPGAGRGSRGRTVIASATVLLGVAAAVTAVFLHGAWKERETSLESTKQRVAQHPPTPPSPAAGPVVLLSPYLYSGPGSERQSMAPASRLSVPADARARAMIGTRVRLTLVGPGTVSIAESVSERDIDLTLVGGRLLVDYDGQGGGTLRVRSPGTVTTVVGTLFCVDAANGETRIAVSRGRVHAQTRTAARDLATGTAWLASGGDVTPIPRDVARALAEHELSPPPPIGEYGIVLVGAPGGAAHPSSALSRKASTVTLDGRSLAAAPLVARISAGSHLVNEGGRRRAIDVAGGTIVQLEGTSPRAPRAESSARLAPPSPPPADPRVAPAPAAPAPGGSTSDDARPAGAVQAPPQRPDLEATYAAAEAAMRAGARDEARRMLQSIVAEDPLDARAEAALLDLARIALADGNVRDAKRYVARLPEPTRDAALAEGAHHLRCQVDLLSRHAIEADACLTAFRLRYPASLHDAEALALLSAHAATCDDARPLLSEYVQRYPDGAFAAAARARLASCGAPRD